MLFKEFIGFETEFLLESLKLNNKTLCEQLMTEIRAHLDVVS